MRIAIVGGLAALVLVATAVDSRADIGPRSPSLRACSGVPEGGACTLDGKPGTCHGPHVSRLSCDTHQPPSQGAGSADGSGSAAAGSATGSAAAPVPPTPASPTNSAASPTGSAASPTPASPEPASPAEPNEQAPSPGHKRGCAVTDAGSASLVGLAIVALGLRRRRRKHRDSAALPAGGEPRLPMR